VVELALALPLVVTLLLGVVQLAVVVADELALQLAAREAARAAAISADAHAAAVAAAHRATGLRPLDITVQITRDMVTVTVGYIDVTDVPLIGVAVGDVELTASATMALEPP
jgi:Flp pilus assembly protein TadG